MVWAAGKPTPLRNFESCSMAPMSLSELKPSQPVERVTPDYLKHQTETKQTTQKGGGSTSRVRVKTNPNVLDLGSPLMFNRSPTLETPDSRTHINTPLLPFSPTSDFHDPIRVARPEELIIFARCSAESSTSKTCLTFFHDRPPTPEETKKEPTQPPLFVSLLVRTRSGTYPVHAHTHTHQTHLHTHPRINQPLDPKSSCLSPGPQHCIASSNLTNVVQKNLDDFVRPRQGRGQGCLVGLVRNISGPKPARGPGAKGQGKASDGRKQSRSVQDKKERHHPPTTTARCRSHTHPRRLPGTR